MGAPKYQGRFPATVDRMSFVTTGPGEPDGFELNSSVRIGGDAFSIVVRGLGTDEPRIAIEGLRQAERQQDGAMASRPIDPAEDMRPARQVIAFGFAVDDARLTFVVESQSPFSWAQAVEALTAVAVALERLS